MPDLIFASRGQAEALAAQEQITTAARKARAEFEEGAKATKVWDVDTAKLARTSESALRSVQTEQDKIAEKISLINERLRQGIATLFELLAGAPFVEFERAPIAASHDSREGGDA